MVSGGISVVKGNGICFLKGGKEDWCDTAGLTANRLRGCMKSKGLLKVWWLWFFCCLFLVWGVFCVLVVVVVVFFPNLEISWLMTILQVSTTSKTRFGHGVWWHSWEIKRWQRLGFRRLYKHLWILWKWVVFHLLSPFVQLSPSVYKL